MKTTTRPITKSPLRLAKQALGVAQDALPEYSSRFSKKTCTQHQLFALLAVREFLKTDYCGLEQCSKDWSDLRDALGLSRVPDHSTLQKASQRLLEKRGLRSPRFLHRPIENAWFDPEKAVRGHGRHRLREPACQPVLRLEGRETSCFSLVAEAHEGPGGRCPIPNRKGVHDTACRPRPNPRAFTRRPENELQ